MFAYGIFKVIYAPHKAFKEIIQNPKYIGPILIMILVAVANMGFIYAIASKTYVEQTLPTAEQLDSWTENSTLWTLPLGVTARDCNDDYINGTYYGNKSMEFSTVNSSQISMQLNNIGSVKCSDPDGYKNLSLRIKWVSPENTPENATIYLLSSTISDYFYYNLTGNVFNSTGNVWNNITIPLETEGWLSNSATAEWRNITGLSLEFAWRESTNLTVRVDGLFFRGIFKSYMENITSYMFNFSVIALMQFIIQWVFLGIVLYIMTKAFGAKTGWRPLLILIGSALITLFVQAAINAVAYSTLPTLYYRLELIGGVSGESEIAYSKILEQTWLASLISRYVQIGVYVWTTVLCAIATRLVAEFSWTKSALVATVAYFASLLVQSLILGF